jgi:hypothetical protein
MAFPIEKYKFITTGNKIIALSTFAGKTVRGTAKCDPRDEYVLADGKALAAARCNAKVASKRVKSAQEKYDKLDAKLYALELKYTQAREYLEDAELQYALSLKDLSKLINKM